MLRSTVSIYNMALARVGGQQLESVEGPWEKSPLGRLCNNNFKMVLEEALSRYPWSFATATVELSQTDQEGEPTGPHGYKWRYGRPTDCLKVIALEPGAPFILAGTEIMTDANPARLTYVQTCEDPQRWTPEFAVALSWSLASVLATAKINDQNLAKEFRAEYEMAVARAWALDGNNSQPMETPGTWVGARFGERGSQWLI